ncbi:MAG: alpha/beta hydrolase, partial [Anaeroplasmataceae bacterium]|nr:alpha/beta hydrolase [Anaeroplasmataceae bacterium]
MKIVTYGNKENEKILLLHPMFTSASFFDFAIEKLSDKYHLIIPTYSGHYENTTYESMENEEKTINDFLRENQIDGLKAIIGFSLGANIAFHYFCHNQEKVSQVIVDSAPIFKFPKFVKRHFYKKYRKCLLQIKAHPENTVNELNKCFNGMGEAQQFIAPTISLESLKNLIESCYNMDTPKLNAESQKKITFVYGTKD